jgi:hypothetical protein
MRNPIESHVSGWPFGCSVVIAALAAAIGVVACGQQAAPTPNITVNVTNSVNVTTTVSFANPIASESAGCAAIGSIEINRPEALKVNDVGKLSITPRDSAGQKRTPKCDVDDGLTTSVNPTDVLGIEDPHAFETTVTGLKPGIAKLYVTVGKATAVADIPVK